MYAALRPYVTAGLVLTTAGVVAVSPVAAELPELPAVSTITTALTAGESLLNVPLNLFQALFNAPANEIHALDTIAQSLFFSGPWWVGSPTNIWGEDPGDPGHFESLMNAWVPFPALSGAGHEGDLFYPGLGQQLAMLATVEIPADPTCASLWCLPVMPVSPITGITPIDQSIWSLLIATGLQKFPLINNWFGVPFSEMTGGNSYFFDPSSPAMHDSGFANDGFLWQGTRTPAEIMAANPGLEESHPDAWAALQNMDPGTNLMPWAGQSYEMNFAQPFINFWNELQQPFDISKFELPNPVDFLRSMQALFASMMVAFNPFTPGSPLCPAVDACLLPGENPWDGGGTQGIPTYYAAVKFIGDLWPGNTTINQWLSDYADGTANISPPEFIETEAALWNWGGVLFNFDNPMPTDPRVPPFIDTDLPSLDQIHTWMNSLLGANVGDYLFNMANNTGIFGPFNMQGFLDALAGIEHPATPPLVDPGEYIPGPGADLPDIDPAAVDPGDVTDGVNAAAAAIADAVA